jgi:hypothetical protein
MKRPNKGGKHIAPQPGGQWSETAETVSSVIKMPLPEKVTPVIPVPLDEWSVGGTIGPPMSAEEYHAFCERENVLSPDRPLVPASEEVARLPRGARTAFAARCAERVARLRPGADTPEAAAALILAVATVDAPIRRQLLCLRRDFDRLMFLAKKHGWTDDTDVPPTVFGPLWPAGIAPRWAEEPPAAFA